MAALEHAPHYRLYVNSFGGGDRRVGWYFPHCDYFDAGVREAVSWIAGRAEPGAEVSSELEWVVRFYAGRDGRGDLVTSRITAARGCGSGRPCYVIVQPGRIYLHNRAALERLALRSPDHVVAIRGADAARVYRLAAGEPLFPEAAAGR